jgi:hypothetical protein
MSNTSSDYAVEASGRKGGRRSNTRVGTALRGYYRIVSGDESGLVEALNDEIARGTLRAFSLKRTENSPDDHDLIRAGVVERITSGPGVVLHFPERLFKRLGERSNTSETKGRCIIWFPSS